jgi:hypothetical protein
MQKNKNTLINTSLGGLGALLLCLITFQTGQVAWAEDDYTSDHLAGYDSIVRDLNGQSSSIYKAPPTPDPLDTVKFHLGFGAIASRVKLTGGEGLPDAANLHGFGVSFGIDLLSPQWQAIGQIMTYDSDTEGQTDIQAKEFALMVQYKIPMQNSLSFILGGGLAARYLELSGVVPAGANANNTTPLSVATAGIEFGFTPAFSIVVDGSYRAALVRDTVDAGSIDGGIRLAGHF